MTDTGLMARLRRALAAHTPRVACPAATRPRASVAAVLHDADAGARLLFIERARHDDDPWSGDLAFPGGRTEGNDADAGTTARRETHEELGISLYSATCLGRLDDQELRVQRLTVSAYVYEVTAALPLRLSAEVRQAFWFPLAGLTEAARIRHHVVEDEGGTRRFPALDLLGPGRPLLWGVTYVFVRNLLGLAGHRLPARAVTPESSRPLSRTSKALLTRELYLPAPGSDTAQWCAVHHLDRHGTREQILRVSAASDTYLDWHRRRSTDGGRTWSDAEPIPAVVQCLPGGGMVTYPGTGDVDPRTGVHYAHRMRRLWPGREPFTFQWRDHDHPFTDHCFVVEKASGGAAVERHLRYEEGPDWDPRAPFDPAFAGRNRAYHGTGFAFADDGTVLFPLACTVDDAGPDLHPTGLVLMRRDPACGTWRPSNRVHVGRQVSARGLLEPDVAVLADGTVLIIARGSDTATTPGRKWVTLSRDGGRSLEPVRELTFDDGGSLYSPSSIHRLLRSARNGRLYWLANICDTPPQGNGPRYPLWLAEIDEARLAVRRHRLVLVDDRGEGDGDDLQLSNFSLLEDRDTGRFEIYLTRIGEDAEHFWKGAVYRYLFEPPA